MNTKMVLIQLFIQNHTTFFSSLKNLDKTDSAFSLIFWQHLLVKPSGFVLFFRGDIYFGFNFSELHFSGYLFFSPKFLNWHQSVNLIILLFFHVFMIFNDIPPFTLKLVMYTYYLFFSFVSVWIYKSLISLLKDKFVCLYHYLVHALFSIPYIFLLKYFLPIIYASISSILFKVQGYSAIFFLSLSSCLICL